MAEACFSADSSRAVSVPAAKKASRAATDGAIADHRALCEAAHAAGALVIAATDLLALALATAPGEIGEIGGRGGVLMLGYFGNQQATESSFNASGWFMSGDLGRFDAHGNVQGGIPSPYVNVPVAQYSVPNSVAKPYPTNLHPWADRGEQGVEALCRLTAYQPDFTRDQLKALYGTKAAYRARVEQNIDELTRAGWFLPVYRDVVLADAATVDF